MTTCFYDTMYTPRAKGTGDGLGFLQTLLKSKDY